MPINHFSAFLFVKKCHTIFELDPQTYQNSLQTISFRIRIEQSSNKIVFKLLEISNVSHESKKLQTAQRYTHAHYVTIRKLGNSVYSWHRPQKTLNQGVFLYNHKNFKVCLYLLWRKKIFIPITRSGISMILI